MSEETQPEKKPSPVEILDSTLDSYEQSIGLTGLRETDVSMYLRLSSEDLRKMSPEDCIEGAYLLNQEAIYVQHEINRFKAQMDWANSRINREVSNELNNYGGRIATHDTRRTLAVKASAAASELQKVVDKAERIIARLSYIPNHLSKLASVLIDYKYSKMSVNNRTNHRDI